MSPHRNLLLIVARGMRSDVLSDAKAWPLATHRLDAVAQRGVRVVATAAGAAERPALTSLLTGLHVREHGCDADPPAAGIPDALPARLREAGYLVAGVGGIAAIGDQLDQAVVTEDVTVVEPARCAYMEAAASKGLGGALTDQRRQRARYGPFEPDRLLLEPDDDIDGFIAQRAVALLERLPDEKPWALLVVFSGPGNDLPPPTMYDGLHRDASELRRGFVPADLRTLDLLAEPDWPRSMLQRLEPATIARLRADYLGRAALVDHGVGVLTSAISRRADRFRTWTVFGSDRGYLLGEHGLVGHRSFLGAAIETPLIVAPPLTMRRPREPFPDGQFSTVDWAATAAHIAGCDRMPRAGRSMLPVFTGDPLAAEPRGGVISECAGRTMLVTERYRIDFDRERGSALSLFDLLNDTDEKTNLVGVEGSAELIEGLRARLALALLPMRARRW